MGSPGFRLGRFFLSPENILCNVITAGGIINNLKYYVHGVYDSVRVQSVYIVTCDTHGLHHM